MECTASFQDSLLLKVSEPEGGEQRSSSEDDGLRIFGPIGEVDETEEDELLLLGFAHRALYLGLVAAVQKRFLVHFSPLKEWL